MALSLSAQDLVDVRRHCGYGAFGAATSDRSLQYFRFYASFSMLEYRMNNMSDQEVTTCQAYVQQCNTMENAIWTASDNLDTDAASVWKHNRDEVNDRMELYVLVRKQLCAFLQVPTGPFFVSHAGSNTVRFQV